MAALRAYGELYVSAGMSDCDTAPSSPRPDAWVNTRALGAATAMPPRGARPAHRRRVFHVVEQRRCTGGGAGYFL